MLLMNCFQNWGSYNHVNWARLPIAFPNLHFNGRYDAIAGHPTLPRTMNMIHDRLSANDPVVVYVDASKRALGLQQHFVLAIGERPNGRIEILNPWGGLRQDLSAYDSPDNNAIRGAIWLDWVAEVKGMAV